MTSKQNRADPKVPALKGKEGAVPRDHMLASPPLTPSREAEDKVLAYVKMVRCMHWL